MRLILISFFPLLAVLINSLVMKTKGSAKVSGWISFVGTFLSFLTLCTLGPRVLEGEIIQSTLWSWAIFSDLTIPLTFLMDQLSLTLGFVVTGIGSLVILFSIQYMEHDERPGKYFTYLSLFIFSMLLLTFSENLLFLFFGWEGVGLCSFLLIGFWYEDLEKVIAGRKALLANRVGDFGIIVGMIGYYVVFKTLSFSGIKVVDPALIASNEVILTISSLFLVLGVTGKSAQIPLYIWLPDAMSGPTPVSALIHAATMVTAGIFLLCRVSFIIAHLPIVMEVITWIGILTALLAALMALTQTDIKKVLAYSTISQIGYMMLACGVGAFSSGMFHVFTHAFFKALLFLGSGSVIYSAHHEQNIFKLGGLKSYLPKTYYTFMIAVLAISGIPMLSGFFSKDEIMWLALNKAGNGPIIYSLALLTALLTAFYMSRLFFITFFGENRTESHHDDHHGDHHNDEIKEGSLYMTGPLMILGVLSVVAGYLGMPHFLAGHSERMFQHFIEKAVVPSHEAIFSHETEYMLIGISTLLIIGSIGLAYLLYGKTDDFKTAGSLKSKFLPLWKLSNNKFYIDEAYKILIVDPMNFIAGISFSVVEKYVIDGFSKGLAVSTVAISGVFKNVFVVDLRKSIFFFIVGMSGVLLTIFLAFKHM